MSSCGDRYLIFDSYDENKLRLLRTDADGSNPQKLIDGDVRDSECSPDGNWVLYSSHDLCRVPIEGGTPTEVASSPGGIYGVISPDGKWIAYANMEGSLIQGSFHVPKIAVIPAAGGSPVHVFVQPNGAEGLRWSPNQKGLQYVLTKNGADNVWEQPLSGGTPRQITNFTAGRIYDFSWTRNGKQLLLAKGDPMSDVVLISNFR